MIRLVATDLDGTLLPSGHAIPERTLDAIRRVQDAGALVVPVTARPPRSVGGVAREFGIRGSAICGCGAFLYDLDSDRVIESRAIPSGAALEYVAALRSVLPGVVFGAQRGLDYFREHGYPTIVAPEFVTVASIDEVTADPVNVLVAKHPTMSHAEVFDVASALPRREGTTVLSTGLCELVAEGVSKASALEALCARLGIARQEVAAFGDLPIDAPMLAWAGQGVAMGNARDDVKAHADEVAPTNDEEGVAVVLERLLSDGLIGAAPGTA